MRGWTLPPPKIPSKSPEEFQVERAEKVHMLERQGLLRSQRIKEALLKVRREDFIPARYRDYAYQEVPLPLPGEQATISCPHSYPLFYEPLGLSYGHRFLEVGLGSGYGTALAREIVGDEGLVIALEIDPRTFDFAQGNLKRSGYHDVLLVHCDGGLGYPEEAPYDRIAVTAACPRIPPDLLQQLKPGGRLILPLMEGDVQHLVLVEKRDQDYLTRTLVEVLYVALRGVCGAE